jgi:hypothetical protein
VVNFEKPRRRDLHPMRLPQSAASEIASRSGFRRAADKKILQYLAVIGRGELSMTNSAMNGSVCFTRLCLHPNNLIARLTIRAAELLMGMLGHSSHTFLNLVTIQ